MYTVDRAPGGFDTYRLADTDAGSAVQIARERGGIAWSFTVGGREIFYLQEESFRDTQGQVRGGCPILFPGCGRFRPGGQYQMHTHGFARERVWEVCGQACTGAAELTLALRSCEETRAVYPFEFRLEHTYRLRGKTLEIVQRVVHPGDGAMPVALGLHPYFNVDAKRATVEVPSTTYQHGEETGTFSGVLPVREALDHVCGNLTGRDAVLHTGLGYDVRVTASDGYRYFVVWTQVGQPFACVEPWTAPPNALNSGQDVTWVADTWEVTTTLSVE